MSGHRRGSISSADQRSAVLLLVPRALPTSSSSAWSPLPLGGRLCPGWTVVGEPAWWRTIRSGTPVLWTVDHPVRRVLTAGDEQITRTALPGCPAARADQVTTTLSPPAATPEGAHSQARVVRT